MSSGQLDAFLRLNSHCQDGRSLEIFFTRDEGSAVQQVSSACVSVLYRM